MCKCNVLATVWSHSDFIHRKSSPVGFLMAVASNFPQGYSWLFQPQSTIKKQFVHNIPQYYPTPSLASRVDKLSELSICNAAMQLM